MVHLQLKLTVLLLAVAAAVASCGKPEPPPPAKAEVPATAPAVNEVVKRTATDVYVYAYPMVLMDVTREVESARVPVDTFHHQRALPDPTSSEGADPNPDMLFSEAWLDLTPGPVVLSVPDTHGRYYVMPLTDAWTNVFQSPGKRTSGTGKGDFVIVGPKWKGELPAELQEIKAPTDLVWLLGRTQTNGRGDVAAVAKLQDQYKLIPLAQWHKPGGKPHALAEHPGADLKTPPVEQVAKMDAKTFFARFAELLPGNPPPKDDARMVDLAKQLGIVPGQPFDMSKFDAATTRAIDDGVQAAREAIVGAANGSLGDLRNGWTINWEVGRYGANYGLRAVRAWMGLGASAPEDAIEPMTHLDGGGHPLNGANRYVLHFDKGKTPPTEAFWSLAMYNDKRAPVANPLNRYAIGDRDSLRFNADGSLDLYLQNESPGRDKESNWLPAPKENFALILRVYWPKQQLLDRSWTPPGIRRAG